MASTGCVWLPPELWVQIFSNLSSQDIKATRLACRSFSNLSSSFLLKRVYFALRPRTMDVLFQIARHPVFSRSVTELVYDITEIKELLPEDCMYKREEGYDRLGGYAEVYKVYAAQEASKKSGDDLACLKFAFSHMPRIQTLRCLGWKKIVHLLLDESEPNPFAYLHIRANEVEKNREDMHAAWAKCWYTSKGPMIWDRMDPYLLASDEVGITKFRTSAQLETVLRAAYETKATISNFSFQNFTKVEPHRGSLLQTAAWDITPARLEASRWLLENLRHLSAGLCTRIIPKPEDSLTANILGELLLSATHLETLGLQFPIMHRCHLKRILGTGRWPRLRSIRLVGMRLRAKTLQVFLQRHAASLKEVDIGLMMVLNDDRRGILADIMAQDLNLDGVRLGSQLIPPDQLVVGSGIVDRNALVRTMEARILHGRSNSLRPP